MICLLTNQGIGDWRKAVITDHRPEPWNVNELLAKLLPDGIEPEETTSITDKSKSEGTGPKNVEKFQSTMDYLSQDKKNYDYKTWFKLGGVYHLFYGGSQEGLEKFKEFSQKGPGYEDGCCERQWRYYSHDRDRMASETTAYKMAKEQGWKWDDKTGQSTPIETQAINIIRDKVNLLHTASGDAYVSVQREGYEEVLPIRSARFENWARVLFFTELKRPPGESSMKTIIKVLIGLANEGGQEIEVNQRIAVDNGTYYLDPRRDDRKIYTISASGYFLISPPRSIIFIRTKDQRELIRPDMYENAYERLPELL